MSLLLLAFISPGAELHIGVGGVGHKKGIKRNGNRKEVRGEKTTWRNEKVLKPAEAHSVGGMTLKQGEMDPLRNVVLIVTLWDQ